MYHYVSGVGSRVTSPLSPKSVISTRAATKTLPFKAKEKSVFFMVSVVGTSRVYGYGRLQCH